MLLIRCGSRIAEFPVILGRNLVTALSQTEIRDIGVFHATGQSGYPQCYSAIDQVGVRVGELA